MTRRIGILVLALGLVACSTTVSIPIDDAYYSPTVESPAPTTPSTPATPSTPTTPSTSIEYINVQDTTVTIRIK